MENRTFRILEGFEEKRFAELHHFSTKLEISKLLAHFAEAKVELLKDKPHLENNGYQIDLHSQIDLKKEAFLSRKRT